MRYIVHVGMRLEKKTDVALRPLMAVPVVHGGRCWGCCGANANSLAPRLRLCLCIAALLSVPNVFVRPKEKETKQTLTVIAMRYHYDYMLIEAVPFLGSAPGPPGQGFRPKTLP